MMSFTMIIININLVSRNVIGAIVTFTFIFIAYSYLNICQGGVVLTKLPLVATYISTRHLQELCKPEWHWRSRPDQVSDYPDIFSFL